MPSESIDTRPDGVFATIEPTRFGWKASFIIRDGWLAWDIVGVSRWRRTRAGIERSARRFVRRCNAEHARSAAAYLLGDDHAG